MPKHPPVIALCLNVRGQRVTLNPIQCMPEAAEVILHVIHGLGGDPACFHYYLGLQEAITDRKLVLTPEELSLINTAYFNRVQARLQMESFHKGSNVWLERLTVQLASTVPRLTQTFTVPDWKKMALGCIPHNQLGVVVGIQQLEGDAHV